MVTTEMDVYNKNEESKKPLEYHLRVTGKDELTFTVPVVDYGEHNKTLGIKNVDIKLFKIGEKWQQYDGVHIKELPKE